MEQKNVKRKKEDYIGLTRLVSQNHFKTEETKSRMRPPENKISRFLSAMFGAWFYHYIKSRFGRKHKYPSYAGTGETGIYRLEDGDVIGVVSDWATDTDESCEIATKMGELNPHFTIHMGDTYFVGEPKEIAANFLNDGCPWYRGSKGSFALLGNHEMYAKGISFFEDLLPTLGLKENDGKYSGQKAGFFCLENDYWRILSLDTGYHSIGKIPILEILPHLGANCRFDDILLNWLTNTVKLNPDDKRGLLLLTHHQYITAFEQEQEYQKPAEQLAALIGQEREVVWIWGHEHKFSMFEKTRVAKGITAYGRCIGHGGMPIELNTKTFEKSNAKNGFSKLVMVDRRPKKDSELGFNGYMVIRVEHTNLKLEYRDANQILLQETWHFDKASGRVTGSLGSVSNELKPEEGKEWNDLYKS